MNGQRLETSSKSLHGLVFEILQGTIPFSFNPCIYYKGLSSLRNTALLLPRHCIFNNVKVFVSIYLCIKPVHFCLKQIVTMTIVSFPSAFAICKEKRRHGQIFSTIKRPNKSRKRLSMQSRDWMWVSNVIVEIMILVKSFHSFMGKNK